MAEILINNIELPKEGTMWLILYPNGMVTYTHPYNEDVVVTDSKAIELPPHGRLIDADYISHDAYTLWDNKGQIRTVVDLGDIDTAPTVLEAST